MLKHSHRIVNGACAVASPQIEPYLLEIINELVLAVGSLTEVKNLRYNILLPEVKQLQVSFRLSLLHGSLWKPSQVRILQLGIIVVLNACVGIRRHFDDLFVGRFNILRS